MSETLNEMCTSWLTNLNWASQSRWQISQLVTNKYQFCGCLTGPNSSWTWTFGIRYADWKNGMRCVQLGFGNVSGNDTKWSTPTTRCMNRAYLWKEHALCYFMATKVGRWKKSHTMCFHSQYFGVRSLHCAACWKKQRLGDETQLWAAYLDYAFPTQRYAASHLWRWWWWKLRCLSRLDGVSCAGYETLVRWVAFGARQQAVLLCCAQHHGKLAMDVEGRLPCTDLPQRS